jgi:hypothetical protein
MGRLFFFTLLAVALVAAVLWARRVWSGQGQISKLRRLYLQETGLPLDQAYGSLERHLERLMHEQPGRPMEFYLRTILAELRRDRR